MFVLDEPNIKTLNKLLKGEYMAIYSYESVLPTMKSNKLRKKLNEILKDHKKHAAEITDRIIKLGGTPNSRTGIAGRMTKFKLKMQGVLRSNHSTLKRLYEGENKGIAMVREVAKGDLDQTSLEMITKMMDTDRDHLKKLEHLIASTRKH